MLFLATYSIFFFVNMWYFRPDRGNFCFWYSVSLITYLKVKDLIIPFML